MTLEAAFLGVIALATTVMAVIHVRASLMAARAAKEAVQAVQQVQRELGPVIANVHRASEDAARLSALALTQMERLDEFVETTTERIDETLGIVQDAILGPVRQGSALWAGLRAAFAVFSSRRDRGRYGREEDDNLFIG